MARKYWTCPCGTRNDRTGGRRKCVNPDCDLRRAKTRRPKHKEIMRGDTYPLFVQAARDIHGVSDESCCVCGKPRPQESRWDRDHDHKTGQPRGLACAGNQGCNILMLPWITAATARGIADAKRRAGEPDAERWDLIAGYLRRVKHFYARGAVAVNV